MNCRACAAPNPDNALFCSQCAEPLTTFAFSLRRKSELREKKSREIELTEEVANRLLKWSKLLGAVLTILALILSVLLGKAYLDLQKDIETGKATIGAAVKEGDTQIRSLTTAATAEIATAQRELPVINTNIRQLKLDVDKYKTVNAQIEKLQSDFLQLQTSVVDLGHKTLRAEKIETTGAGTSMLSFGNLGCSPADAKGSPISYCVDKSSLALNSMTEAGKTRPVASFSNIGFQDVSTSPKPPCNDGLRGTIYVQKGQSRQPDHPLCA